MIVDSWPEPDVGVVRSRIVENAVRLATRRDGRADEWQAIVVETFTSGAVGVALFYPIGLDLEDLEIVAYGRHPITAAGSGYIPVLLERQSLLHVNLGDITIEIELEDL